MAADGVCGTGTIRARMRGAFVAEAVSGRVLSRHEQALNIIEEGSGLLVSLLLDEGDMTGMGILVDRLPEDCVPGEPVHGPGVRLAAARVLFGGAAAWDGRVPPGSPPQRRMPDRLRGALCRAGAPGGFLSLLVASDTNLFGLRAQELLSGQGGAEALVGLGPGFTPSGDDFLAGALLAGSWLGDAGPAAPALDCGAIRAALDRTTPGGRTLLFLALQGSYPAYLLRFVEQARAASGSEDVEEAVRQAAAHGQTSGTDALLGLLWRLGGLGAP